MVNAAIAVSPARLPALTVGSPFLVTESALGGSGGPYTFTITAGALPSGWRSTPAQASSAGRRPHRGRINSR